MDKSQVQMNKESTDANLAAFKQRRSRGRLVLVGLILIFALPAIIAKTVLEQNWYTSGVTNTGELVEPRVTLQDFWIDDSGARRRLAGGLHCANRMR